MQYNGGENTILFCFSRPYSTASPRNTIKTKLLPISFNDPIDILDKAKRNRVKNVTRDDYEIADDDGDEIQGDASGITVPISKSLGKKTSRNLRILKN